MLPLNVASRYEKAEQEREEIMNNIKILLPYYDADILFVNRVKHWIQDEKVIELYKKMYHEQLLVGQYDDIDVDLYDVVDNDVMKNCKVIYENDPEYKAIKLAYMNSIFDISKTTSYDFIEAESKDLKMFLVRK